MIFNKILVRMSSFKEAIPHILLPKAKYLSAFSLGCSLMILGLATSCSVSRHMQLQVAEHIHKDTVYLCNIQYDSIYIYKDKFTDRSRDTLYIKELHTEYRNKYLRDTVRIVQRDSIPYEVRITETVQVRKPPNFFDYLCYFSFGILIGIIGWRFLSFIRKFL